MTASLAHIPTADLERAWLHHVKMDPLFAYRECAPGQGGMSPGQETFHADASSRRVLQAANQIGKTRAGSAEAWWHLTGRHPYREVAPSDGWIIIPDLNDWPKISKKLREIEPPNTLDAACKYDSAKGYTYRGARGLKVRSGALALPKSGTQQQTALAGETLGWLWFDEPPRESHWGEALTRVAVSGGSVWLTFTPIGKPLTWLKVYLHGDAETGEAGHPDWSITLVKLNAENVPHRTPENIAAQIAEYSPWEYAQRVEAAWEGVTKDRYLSAFTEGCVIPTDAMPNQVQRVGLGMDHGEGVGKEYAVLVVKNGDRLYAIDEYSASANSTPAMDAAAIVAMLARSGLTPQQVGLCKGDINSGGKLGAGLSVNDLMEREFARLTKLSVPPFRIEPPAKGKGSVDSGRRVLNNGFVSGNLFITEACPRLIHACRHWRGGSELKDPVDALRYIAVEMMDVRARGPGKLTMV